MKYRFALAAIPLLIQPAMAQVVAPQPAVDPLAQGFAEPPLDARPLVYWQWVNGNVSEDGIVRDLEWMQRVGLGGVFLFDVGFGSPPIPQYVERRIGFGTPEWESAVRLASTTAGRLGLSFGAQSSGGWSVSGDPGVTAEQAMKKFVWSETTVAGGNRKPGPVTLAPLPKTSGPFQDLPIADRFRNPEFGGDIAVLAWRRDKADRLPAMTLSGVEDAGLLSDGRFDRAIQPTIDAGGNVTLIYRFDRPVTPGAFTLSLDGVFPDGRIEADGVVRAQLSGPAQVGAPVRTWSLAGSPAREWRVVLTGLKAAPSLREANFVPGARIDRFEDKAGFGTLTDYEVVRSAPKAGLSPRNVIDLTDRLRPDGTLDWKTPSGEWTIMRFGWSLTGRRDTPAAAESTGLEIDKLDADVVRAYATRFYDRYRRVIGPQGRMDIAISDSWEAGQQSWSPALRQAFRERRGYDPQPWYPALAGLVVGDADASERFLADWRRTIADLIADNHYGIFADVLRARGMTYYAEAAGTDLPTGVDGLQAKARVDVPMGEYWYLPDGAAPKPVHVADIREAASAAHLYGKRMVAAEALTTMGEEPWASGPREWRGSVDRFFAEGVNRVVMHTYAHQPWNDRRPGMTLRQYGQHFTRNEAWADLASGWVSYLARTSYLLQQGDPVADIAIFLGEGAPLAPPFADGVPPRVTGHDHDYVDAETLMKRAVVRDGAIDFGAGGRYRVLAIDPGVKRMSVGMARHLLDLVRQGATLVGNPPVGPQGMGSDAQALRDIVAQIWGDRDESVRTIGAGRVVRGHDVAAVLAAKDVAKDFDDGGAGLAWTHRRLPDGDIYFVANLSDRAVDTGLRLRGEALASDRTVEYWNAVDGSRTPAVVTDGLARLRLPAGDSLLLVSRRRTAPAAVAAGAGETTVAVEGPWRLQFRDGMGAPAMVDAAGPGSWTDSPDPAIRYYSGLATYAIDLNIRSDQRQRITALDLGRVGEIARVRLNGQDLGIRWAAPYRFPVGSALKIGRNRLEIDVANYWRNRFIGDRQPGAKAQTFAPIAPYVASDLLRPSGLLEKPFWIMGVSGNP